MGVDGRYVLNGNWEVSPPGTYEAAGTHVVYARAAAPQETLHAAGPTSQDLLLQILLQEPNPGIQFEFWLPRERYGPFQVQTQALGPLPMVPCADTHLPGASPHVSAGPDPGGPRSSVRLHWGSGRGGRGGACGPAGERCAASVRRVTRG
uniref:ADAMTS/ADAMTS-like Spacer 1 domain-containing protein n=1 Tax=Spermophilus dauricus TaxID=99837 RepID=A0A8C9PH20_SPEDA